jgi:hypothetical protein
MASAPGFESPRVLLVLPDQWPRALLRAELREEGYDAVGARSLEEAMVYRPEVPERGPVRLVLVEGDAVGEGALADLLARHGNPPAVLLAHAGQEIPPGPWLRVIRRPVSIADLARVVRELVPLRDAPARPLDR